MTRSKYAPLKRLRDWEGQRVRVRRDIRTNGGDFIKAGEECIVQGATAGKLHLATCATGDDGRPRTFIRMVSIENVELVNPPEPEKPPTAVFYRARFVAERNGLDGEVEAARIEVISAEFEIKPNTWVLCKTSDQDGVWGWRRSFRAQPGESDPISAVRRLVDLYSRRFSDAVEETNRARKRLSLATKALHALEDSPS